jgi:hypothetical protein
MTQMNQAPPFRSKRKYTSRKRKKEIDVPPKWMTPSDQCINDVLPMNDLIYNITHFLPVSDIIRLSLSCKNYQDLIPDSFFKRLVDLEEEDENILKSYFEPLNDSIPYKNMAFSYSTGRCVICKKIQYCHLFNHLPFFYACRTCCSQTEWLKSICKTTVESFYFLTKTQQAKHQISLRSFYITNPYYKSAPEMELFWEIEVKYNAEKIFGGVDGFLEERAKREKKRELMAEKRQQQSQKRPKNNHRDQHFRF